MFHDKTLDRTTNSTGLITSRPYYGENGIEHVRTLKEPVQQIPTFEQLCKLLMEPGNEHVKFNIDVKPNNDPARLFEIMARTVDRFPQSKERLHPRLILGLWHPKFIAHAKQHVPTLRRAHIGGSPADAIKYFWKDCEAFSIYFPSLVTAEGQAFIKKAQQEGKDVMTWTVNRTDEMVAATSWGLKAILTDRTDTLNQLRKDMTGAWRAGRAHQQPTTRVCTASTWVPGSAGPACATTAPTCGRTSTFVARRQKSRPAYVSCPTALTPGALCQVRRGVVDTIT